MKKIKLLISAIGHSTTSSMIKTLKENGEREIEVIGVDITDIPIVKSSVDKFLLVPKFDDKFFLKKILSICKKQDIDIYYPRRDEEISIISKNKKKFDNLGVKLIFPTNHNVLNISSNKLKFHQIFKKNNIPHAKFFGINKFSDLEKSIKNLGYPQKKVILKPTLSIGGRGAILLNDKIHYDKMTKEESLPQYDLKYVLNLFSKIPPKEFPELIVMEFLNGQSYSVDVLSKNGKQLYAIPKIRIRGNASNTTVGIVDMNNSVINLTKKICKLFKFSYLQNYEIKLDNNNQPKVYDINPRGGASIAFCSAAGVNLLYFAVKMALSEPIPRNLKIKDKLKMIRVYQEFYEY